MPPQNRYPTLAEMFGLEPEAGKVPSGALFNEAQPRSIERQRETSLIEDSQNRAEAGIQADLKHHAQVHAARELGFGDYDSPLKAMADEEAAAEMAKVGEPARIAALGKLEEERIKGDQQRQTLDKFAAVQSMLNGGGQKPSMTDQVPRDPLGYAQWSRERADKLNAQKGHPTTNGVPNATAPAKQYLDDNGEPTGGAPSAPQAPDAGGPDASTSYDYKPKPEFRMNMGVNGPSMTQVAPRRPNAAGQNTIDALRASARLMSEARDLIRQSGPDPNPVTPEKTGGIGGFFNQLAQVGKAGGSRALYGAGFPDPTLSGNPKKAELYDKITQIVELSKVLATRGLQGGTRNMQWIKQIQDHVANGNMPTATQLQRIEMLMQEYPKMIKDIYDTSQDQPLIINQAE